MHTHSRTRATIRIIALALLCLALNASCQPPTAGGASQKPSATLPEATADGSTDKTADKRKADLTLIEIPRIQKGETILQHTGFTLSFNDSTNCPNWVAWQLTADEAQAQGERNPDFYVDPDVEEEASQVNTRDYSGSGYDRGHMCPSADMKWSTEAQHDCFYMTNICPQDRDLNGKSWERLERACRRWATKEGSVYIVCGPIYHDWRSALTIGRDHTVRVPDAFFKVVLSLRQGKEKAIGFYYVNDASQQNMEAAATTVDEIERMTGYDFFPRLDKRMEATLEAQCNLRAWD